jgi:phospholipid/cholesterol/gamma-HCH transport system substrate-binding protein
MARRASWKDLIIGIASVLVIVGGALGILIFGSVGRLHGKTATIYATTDAARGLIGGSEVWLDGQKIGLVRKISFRPPSVNPRERLVIQMAVLDDARPNLRLDSRVSIRAGATLIGDQVVYLTSGTSKMRGVVNGDTIHGGEQTDVEEMTSDMALAAHELPGILENVKLLTAQLAVTEGTLGALGLDQGGSKLASLRLRTARLMTRLTSSSGTLGRGMGMVSDVRARAASAMAQADSIRALVGSTRVSLGRFRRDSTLIIEMERIRTELANIQQLAASPDGTIGRARTDSAIGRNIHLSLQAIDSLVADMKKHPLRYIAF